MASYTTKDIRNLALVGHGGAGKTTLTEKLLLAAGTIHEAGAVEKGTTVCDYEEEEKKHGHSLTSALVHIDHAGKHINLIDTPGYPDFMGYALCAMPAVETCAVVVNAERGIEMMTRRMMNTARERNLCRMIIINKIDAPGVDLPGLVEQIQEMFGRECMPLNLPSGGGTAVTGVFARAEGESDFGDVATAHTELIEQCVEVDEEVALAYLEGNEISDEQLHEVFEKGLRSGHLVPICFTSAAQDVGINELLSFFVRLAPNPTEGNPRPFYRGEGEEGEPFQAVPDADQHAIAHVFRVAVDPFVGKLSCFRIHQGTITKDSQLFVGDGRKPFKVGHLFKLQGKEQAEIQRGIPGDIAAVAKVEEIEFDAVLHDSHDEDHIHLKPLNFPSPMHGLAIEAKNRGDVQKISKSLHAMEIEDPCFTVERNSITKEMVIRGIGDLHLRVCLEKMKNRFGLEVDTHPPRIAYRETITSKAEGHYRHKKQSGGAGQFGEVFLRVEPLERDEGFEFENKIFGGAIPSQFVPAVEKGVRHVLDEGAVAGYPLQDMRVTVYDGKHHPVDSKEVAFVTAARRAFIAAVGNATPVLLEPFVTMDITVPESNMGDIARDMSSKRGRILGQETSSGGMVVIHAQAPLAELGSYVSQLKGVTGGQGSYAMEFSHYEIVPPDIQQRLVSAYKPRAEED